MPGVVCRSVVVNTVRSLVWELVCIKALSLAHCSSSWWWKRYRTSFSLVCHGNFSMLMTWCSSWTSRRNASPTSRHGRLVWKLKNTKFMVSSVGLDVQRNLVNIPVLPAARLSATTPSSTHIATCGSTRSVVVSLVDWWHTRTSAPGVMASLGLLTANQWLKWMLKAPSLIWRLLSAVWVTCCAPVALWPCHCRQMLCGLRKVQEIIACPHLQLGYAPWLRNMGIEHIRPRAATLQWLCHDPMDLCHQRPWWNTLFITQEPWH